MADWGVWLSKDSVQNKCTSASKFEAVRLPGGGGGSVSTALIASVVTVRTLLGADQFGAYRSRALTVIS